MRSSSSTRTSTTPGKRRSRFRSIETATARFRPLPLTACGTASTSSPRSQRIPIRDDGWRGRCGISSSAKRWNQTRNAARCRERLSAKRDANRINRPTRAALTSSSRTRGTGVRVLVGRSSTWCGPSKKSVGRVFGRHAPRAVVGDGSDAVRTARRQRLGAGPGMVYDRRHVGANEFRRGSCEQSTPQSGAAEIGSSGSSAESVLDLLPQSAVGALRSECAQ